MCLPVSKGDVAERKGHAAVARAGLEYGETSSSRSNIRFALFVLVGVVGNSGGPHLLRLDNGSWSYGGLCVITSKGLFSVTTQAAMALSDLLVMELIENDVWYCSNHPLTVNPL